MKLFIPRLGTQLTLKTAWTFTLHNEHRNSRFRLLYHGKGAQPPSIKTTIPTGAKLVVERIYIRKGASDFDSITFRLLADKALGLPGGRFWVKLDEINDNLDVHTHFVEKWPEGRFTLIIKEGKPSYCKVCGKYYNLHTLSLNPNYCDCSIPSLPQFVKRVLSWESRPEASSWDRCKLAIASHFTDESGVDEIKTETISTRGGRCNEYSKTFTNYSDLITWAQKKNFTKEHVDAFTQTYLEKKVEADKEASVDSYVGEA